MHLKNVSKAKYVIRGHGDLHPGKHIVVTKENSEHLASLAEKFKDDLLVVDEAVKPPKIEKKSDKA